MKKVLMIFGLSLAMACGDGSQKTEKNEAAAEKEVDIGAGEEISPQMELDSTRFEVDTVNSTQEVEKESDPDAESF